MTFTDTTFSGNWCGGDGGALSAIFGGSANTTLTRTNFSGNAVGYRKDVPDPQGSYRGGALYASGNAPGMHTRAEACLFDGNDAGSSGGAVSVEGGTFYSDGCDFSDNVAGNGGAIAASEYEESSAVVSLRDGYMRRNSAEPSSNHLYYGYGGALQAEEGAEAFLFGVTLEENSGAFGGAVSLSSGAQVTASGVEFSSNVAGVGGGAVQVWGNSSRFTCEGCAFDGNFAEGESTSTLTSSSSSTTAPTIDSAGAAGGAVYVTDGGGALMENSTLSDNAADGRGGGVYCGSAANVTVARGEFNGQRSGQGGNGEAHGGACAAVADCSVR